MSIQTVQLQKVVQHVEPDWWSHFLSLRQQIDGLKLQQDGQQTLQNQLLQQIAGEITSIKNQLTLETSNLAGEINNVKQSFIADISEIKHEFRGEITQVKEHTSIEISQVQQQLSGEIIPIKQVLADESQEIDALSAQIHALEIKPNGMDVIKNLEQRVAALELMTSKEESELEKRVHEIESRGNVKLDLMSGRLQVLREIAFVPVKSSMQSTDNAVATLRDPNTAARIIDDIAAVLAFFENEIVTVEGHTGGGESEFWQALADNRARFVGQELVNRGQPRAKVLTKGFPGKKGTNKSEVVVRLAMSKEGKKDLRKSVSIGVSG